MTIGLSEGLVLQSLESKEVGDIIVKHISRMPKKAKQAMGIK
jgi:hypothetical protein